MRISPAFITDEIGGYPFALVALLRDGSELLRKGANKATLSFSSRV